MREPKKSAVRGEISPEDRPDREKIQQLAARLGLTTAALHKALWHVDLQLVPANDGVDRDR